MNRDVTQRLLKESIICLCRSHIFTAGLEGVNFEIDGLICISQGETEQQMVFKIHELVQGDEDAGKDIFVNPRFGGSQMRRESRDLYSTNHSAQMGSRPQSSNKSPLATNGAINVQTRTSGSLVPGYSAVLNSQNSEFLTNPPPMMPNRKRKTTSPRHCPQFTKHSLTALPSVSSTNIPDVTGSVNFDSIPAVVKAEPVWQEDDGMSQNYFGGDDRIQPSVLTSHDDDERVYSCSRCTFKCETQGDIEEHVKMKHDVSEVYVCPGCSIAYTSEVLFLNHTVASNCVTQFHDGASTDNQTDRTSNVVEKIDNNRGNPRISSTQKHDESSMISARREKTMDSTLDRNKRSLDFVREEPVATSDVLNDRKEFDIVVDREVSEEESLDQSTPRSCTECRVDFSDSPSFNVHSSQTHGLFPCPYCRRTFAQECERETHLFEHTGESSPIECVQCNLSFSRPDSLARHLAKTHGAFYDNSKSDAENRDTILAGNLAQIRRAPTFSQPEQSNANNDPNVGLSEYEYLERITNYVDPAIEISDEEYDEMGASSAIGSRLMALDPWRTFRCETCAEHLTGVASYTEHCALVHRRIPCPYCGATFTQKASMERHQRQHTGVKPYRCTICANSFTRKETLHTHMTRMHPVMTDFVLY